MANLNEKKITEKELAELPIIHKKITNEKEEKHLREIGEYEFTNLEESGLMQKFVYGDTRKNHTFVFLHGGRYKVPRFIARHVESCSTPRYEWKPDGSGKLQKSYAGRKQRFSMREVYA